MSYSFSHDVIDFSDHVQNPQKYGFSKVEFIPEFYWEHETLNLKKCLEIKDKWRKSFVDHSYTRFGGSAQAEYPTLRALGFNHNQTANIMKIKVTTGKKLIDMSNFKKNKIKEDVLKISIDEVKKYHTNLVNSNT